MSAVWGTAVKGGTLQRRCLAAGGDDGFLRKAAIAVRTMVLVLRYGVGRGQA